MEAVHPKGDQSWVFFGTTDAKAETPILWPPQELTHWKRPWCWEGLGAGGEGDDTRWDGWMASPTRWTWVWVKSGSWWWTGKSGVLRLIGSQRVRRDRATELTDWMLLEHIHSPTGTVWHILHALTQQSEELWYNLLFLMRKLRHTKEKRYWSTFGNILRTLEPRW